MCLSFALTSMEYHDVLPTISRSRMIECLCIKFGLEEEHIRWKYENINNSNLDGISLASFCQSRAALFSLFERWGLHYVRTFQSTSLVRICPSGSTAHALDSGSEGRGFKSHLVRAGYPLTTPGMRQLWIKCLVYRQGILSTLVSSQA